MSGDKVDRDNKLNLNTIEGKFSLIPLPNKQLLILAISGLLYYQLSSSIMRSLPSREPNLWITKIIAKYNFPGYSIKFLQSTLFIDILLFIDRFIVLSLLVFYSIKFIQMITNSKSSWENENYLDLSLDTNNDETPSESSRFESISMKNSLYYSVHGIEFHYIISLFIILTHQIASLDYVFRVSAKYWSNPFDFFLELLTILVLTSPIWIIVLFIILIQEDPLKYALTISIPLLLTSTYLTTTLSEITILCLFSLEICFLLFSAIMIRISKSDPDDVNSKSYSKYLKGFHEIEGDNKIDDTIGNKDDEDPLSLSLYSKLSIPIMIILPLFYIFPLYGQFVWYIIETGNNLNSDHRSQSKLLILLLLIIPGLIATSLRKLSKDQVQKLFKFCLGFLLILAIITNMTTLSSIEINLILFQYTFLYLDLLIFHYIPAMLLLSVAIRTWMDPYETPVDEEIIEDQYPELFIEV